MYKISVIIPLYNKEQYCADAIQSVLTQNYPEFELIIINDGSTDNSETIARQAIEGEPRAHIINQDNKGVSAARNMGVKKAKYDYLAFLDADDLWHPNYLEVMMSAIIEHPDEHWFGVSFKRFSENFNMPILAEQPVFKKLNYFLGSFHPLTRKRDACSLVYSDSFIITKELFYKAGGYPIGVIYSEDIYLYYKLALISEIIWSPIELTYYRMNVDNQAVSMIGDKPIADFIVEILSSSKRTRKKYELDFIIYQVIRWVHGVISSGEHYSTLKKLPLKYILMSFGTTHFRAKIFVKYFPAAFLFRYSAKAAKLYLQLTASGNYKGLFASIMRNNCFYVKSR